MTTAYLSPVAKNQFFDNNGYALAGGLIYTYQNGTTINQATYTDATGATPNANPIVLDSSGRADIWLGPQLYTIVCQTASGTTLWTENNVQGLGFYQGQFASYWGGTATGSANALAITTSPVISSYTVPLQITFIAGYSNTGATTVNVDGLGVKNIYKATAGTTAPLTGGELTIGCVYQIVYNGTQFILLGFNTIPNSQLAVVPGLTLKGNSSSSTLSPSDLSVATVNTMLGTSPVAPSNFSNLIVAWNSITQININSAYLSVYNPTSPVGSYLLNTVAVSVATGTVGANGLDAGSIASNQWYYIYVIYNPSTATIASLMSLSATAPTLPSGYTFFARVGSCRTDGSNNLIGFKQYGRDCQYVVGQNLSSARIVISGTAGSATTPTYVATSINAFVPSTAFRINLYLHTAGGESIAAPNNNYGAFNSLSNAPPLSSENSGANTQQNCEMTLESSNIYYAADSSSSALFCLGYTDNF